MDTKEQLKRRNEAVRASKDEANEAAALIYMCQWCKRRGVTKDSLQALGVWSEAEMRDIDRIYRYSY